MYNIENAIAALQRDIEEKNKRVKILQNAQEHGIGELTEDTYHEMCLTYLRGSDLLGNALTKVFPFLTYEEGGCNYFYYRTENGISVRIPNSAIRSVEIVVDRYFRDADKAIASIESKYALSRGEYKRTIREGEEYFTTKSIVRKAKIIYQYHYVTWYAVLCYLFSSRKKLRKRVQQRLTEAQRGSHELSCRMEEEIVRAKENRVRQQTELMRLAADFLKWTKRVNIYEKGSMFEKEEFYMENNKIIFKENR